MYRILIELIVLSVFFPGLALGQTMQVTVRVDGLSCPFCAYSLEKKLKAVEGVAGLTIDVAGGLATIVPADSATIDFSGLPRAVQDAGFTPREITAHGTGQVRHDGDTLTLIDVDGSALFVLEPNQLAQGIETNVSISFEGLVQPPASDAGGVPRLSLTVATPEHHLEKG